jgi:hypothetical protein
MRRIIVCLLCVSVFSVACKKNDTKKDVEQTDGTEWTIMSNPTDPMFAIAKTDSSQVEFYGERDSQGIPSKLKLFIVKTLKDTISYYLDDLGRLLTVQNSNGFQFGYVWTSDKKANLTIESPDGLRIANAPISMARLAEGSLTGSEHNSNRISSGNIVVQVTKCNTAVTSKAGEVSIQLTTVQGNQQQTIIPAYYVNGQYSASLPYAVTNNLVSSPELCEKITNVISTGCTITNVPGVAAIMDVTCIYITSLIASGGITAVVAPAFEAACTAGAVSLQTYCKLTSKAKYDKICNAVFTKRIFDQGIYLQPVMYYNGKKVVGEKLSTIGGSQLIELKLELGCPYAELAGTYNGYAIWTNYDGTGQDPKVGLSFSIAIDQNGVLSGNMTVDGHLGAAVGSVTDNSITIGWTEHDAPFKYNGTFSADKKTIEGSGGAGNYYAPRWNPNGPFKVVKQ